MCVCIQALFLLFLLFGNSCADNSTAAYKQQCNPQHEVAVVAGLGRLRQLRRYGVGLFDLPGAVLVTVILITSATVPILDVALGILGGRLGGDMHKVGVVLRVRLSVSLAANLAYRLVPAGFITSDVVCDHLSTVIADVVFVCILMVGDDLSAVVPNVVFVCVLMVGDRLSAIVADMVIVRVCVIGNYLFAVITNMIFVCVLVVGDRLSAVVADMIFI